MKKEEEMEDDDGKEMKEIKETSEIRVAIKNYEDIFSDFDPRPLSERGLSEDFLLEIKKASLVKRGHEINFIALVPKKERDLNKEMKITQRLRGYFKKHFGILKEEKNKMIKIGTYSTLAGMVLMLIATYLLFKFKNQNLIASFFTILFEPAGWFIFWHGLDYIVFEPKKINPDIDFHKKMTNAKIRFVSV
jgi:hypothetical protein